MYVCQGEIIGTWGKYWSKWHLWILIICKSGKMVLKVRFWGIPPKLSERLTFSKTGKGESVHLLRNKKNTALPFIFISASPFVERAQFLTFFWVLLCLIFLNACGIQKGELLSTHKLGHKLTLLSHYPSSVSRLCKSLSQDLCKPNSITYPTAAIANCSVCIKVVNILARSLDTAT